jgi:hypothetical protein
MDLRNVRSRFYEKKSAYAISYDPRLSFDLETAAAVPGGLRIELERSSPSGAAGSFFHVHDALSVDGVDGRRHSTPAGEVVRVEETILFREKEPIGYIKGRMSLRTADDAARDTRNAAIDATYKGVLRLRAPAPKLFDAAAALEGDVWLVPVFQTSDTRYRWLLERACTAFGTWSAKPSSKGSARHDVTCRLDVYSNG